MEFFKRLLFRAGERVMARKPKVWFRKQTGWYMTTIDGEQIKLSKDKKESAGANKNALKPSQKKSWRNPPCASSSSTCPAAAFP
jgi:hypothetical protein